MASTGEAWRLGRRPELDGLRGIACLLVLVAHLVMTETQAFAGGGGIGVGIFFTLSGFLITSLLLEERDRTGRISLGAFYQRRARRLLPALGLYVGVLTVVGSVLGPWVATGRGAAWSLLYVGNWPMAGGGDLGAFSHTWSLAIEEQFYLLWPLLVIVVLRNLSELTLLSLSLIGITASIATRFMLWDYGTGADRIYFGSDARADAILLGCAAALIMRRIGAGRSRPRLAGALVLTAAALGFIQGHEWVHVWLPLPVSLLAVGALMLATRGTYRGWLTAPLLAWIGRRSYGLYLWHFGAFIVLSATDLPWAVWAPVCVAVTFAVAELSWRYVEGPFLSRRPSASAPPPLMPARTSLG